MCEVHVHVQVHVNVHDHVNVDVNVNYDAHVTGQGLAPADLVVNVDVYGTTLTSEHLGEHGDNGLEQADAAIVALRRN